MSSWLRDIKFPDFSTPDIGTTDLIDSPIIGCTGSKVCYCETISILTCFINFSGSHWAAAGGVSYIIQIVGKIDIVLDCKRPWLPLKSYSCAFS